MCSCDLPYDLPYDHDYTVVLSIGFSGADRMDTINPSDAYTEAEWNSLTEEERQEWLQEELKAWAQQYIETAVYK